MKIIISLFRGLCGEPPIISRMMLMLKMLVVKNRALSF